MVLVTVACCPEIISKDNVGDPHATSIVDVADVVKSVVDRSLIVNCMKAKTIDKIGQVQ